MHDFARALMGGLVGQKKGRSAFGMRWRVSEELTAREDEEFGVPHPSGGPGRAPWRFDGREDHEKAWDPNAHVDISSPQIGLRGGGGGGGSMSKQAVSLLLECLVGSLTPHEPIHPVVKVREHVYKTYTKTTGE